MSLNEARGNMFSFVSHTWNVIKGKCKHDCIYCYMKIFKLKPMRFDERELETNLGENNFIFVGSSIDMFANDVPEEWILRVLEYCNKFPTNKYLFQSKNPERFYYFFDKFPSNSILGTTIESNKDYQISKAPKIESRVYWLSKMNEIFNVMVTIEPIMQLDVNILANMIKGINPKWVNIGADSKGHNLPEPSPEKIKALIAELRKITEVKLKPNLKRLVKESSEL